MLCIEALDKASGKKLDFFVDQQIGARPRNPQQLIVSTPGAYLLPHLRVIHVVTSESFNAAGSSYEITNQYHKVLNEMQSNLFMRSVTFSFIAEGAVILKIFK